MISNKMGDGRSNSVTKGSKKQSDIMIEALKEGEKTEKQLGVLGIIAPMSIKSVINNNYDLEVKHRVEKISTNPFAPKRTERVFYL